MRIMYVANKYVKDVLAQMVEVADCREGVLLDSCVGFLSSGKAILCKETYETSHSSGYTVYVAQDADENQEVLDEWQMFADIYDDIYYEEKAVEENEASNIH